MDGGKRMAIKSRKELHKGKIKIDLTGPQGNAFFLLAYADQLAKQLDKDVKDIIAGMKSSDYENLIKVFDAEFGDYVDLYR
jgi:hypothetical protein